MSAFHDNALMGASGQQGYKISRSVRLRSSASAYFNRTPAGAGNLTTWTWSAWVKLGSGLGTYRDLLTSGSANPYTAIYFANNDKLEFVEYSTGVVGNKTTTQVFRDPSAWYHIVCVWDTSNATAGNRIRIYVNGVQVTSFSNTTDPTLNRASNLNTVTNTALGKDISGTNYFDGYLTEINFIDGQALTPSSFGETNAVTGVWQPKKFSGTYGTNGFYLNFSDNSSNTATTIGKDYSGNGNNWTPNNISVTAGSTYDSMLDVPTLYADGGNGRGNYAVMNPLTSQGNTVSDGNLKVTLAASLAGVYGTRGSIAISSGNKFYWEISPTTTSSVYTVIGIIDAAYKFGTDIAAAGSNCVLYYKSSGNKIVNGTTTSYGTTYAANDVIGVAVDYSANTCTFYLNNVSQGAISLPSTSIDYIPVVGNENLVADVFQANFGQRPFSYTPPTGFVALNTQNLPTPTISNGANYMAATTYTGTNATLSITNTVNGVSSKPDFIWIKSRSNAYSHLLWDSVRGVTLALNSDRTAAEQTATGGTGLASFNSNGFTLGAEFSGAGSSNIASVTYVAWQWQAGAGSSSSNTSGSITSTVSAGATQGFSVVTYTGTSANATVGHGLGVAPSMVIVKDRTAARTGYQWPVWHTSLGGGTKGLFLNVTDATATDTVYWNSTIPTSSVFSVGTWGGVNYSGDNFVAYCFAAVAGYSAFGSYTGNGSTDGPFVFTNFRPRFVMIKKTSATGNWVMVDTSRSTYNAADNDLLANLASAEIVTAGGAEPIDILSNGFKLRYGSAGDTNTNGATFIYACFAENPFKNSLAR